jgi:uncharacterized protein YbdZ (MbtH family)
MISIYNDSFQAKDKLLIAKVEITHMGIRPIIQKSLVLKDQKDEDYSLKNSMNPVNVGWSIWDGAPVNEEACIASLQDHR